MRRRRAATRRCRRRRPGREHAELGPVRGADRRVPGDDPAAGRPGAVGRGRQHVRVGEVGRRLDRHRPLRCQRAGRIRPRVARDQHRPRRGVCERPDRGIMNGRRADRLSRPMIEQTGATMSTNRLQATLRRTGPERLARQPQAGVHHLRRTRRAPRPRRPRAHLEPVDLPEGDPGIERLRRPVRRTRRARAARSSTTTGRS